MARWYGSIGPSQKLEKSAFEDIPWVAVDSMTGMNIPLTNDVSWKDKAWRHKSTRIGLLGVVVICILLSAIVALAVLLFEARNNHAIRDVYDIPNSEMRKSSNDMYWEYTTMENKQTPTSVSSMNNTTMENKQTSTSVSSKNNTTMENKQTPTSDSSNNNTTMENKQTLTSVSSKIKEIEEAIMENAMSSGREDTSTEITSRKQHEETSTANPNSLQHKDTSAEITIKPVNQESTSSSDYEETSTESPEQMMAEELLIEELQDAKDLVNAMNVSSNGTMVAAAITVIELEIDLLNDTDDDDDDYDELSEVDFGATSEVLFGDESELVYGKTSDMEYYDNEDDEDGLSFDESNDPALLQNDLEMVPKSGWDGVPPDSINLYPGPRPYGLYP